MNKLDWGRLQRMAADLDRPVSTLVAQATSTDPFYVGEARMRAAQWFKDLYDGHQLPRGIHLRRIHYRLVSQETPVIMPSGEPYENTNQCARVLNNASRDARYAGLVEIDAFIDRKNPEPQIFLAEPDSAPVIGIEEEDEPADPIEVELAAPKVCVTVDELAIGTAQRRGDLVRIGSRHVINGTIAIKQSKTGAEVTVPIVQELASALDLCPRDRLTFIAQNDGCPLSPESLGSDFQQWRRAAGLPENLSLHGLRHAAATRMASAGASVHEIKAVTGHKTLAEVERYTREAEKTRLAATGMAKVVEMYGKKTKE